jgi:cyclic pyranopterin phosphate synthase
VSEARAFTHFDSEGRPRMVDLSDKKVTDRFARARGAVRMAEATFEQLAGHGCTKGDVFRVPELAGIMGAKRTSDLIPLCHPVPLSGLRVAVDPDRTLPGLVVTAEARTSGRTGVEMEALVAVSVACLTIYDMLKAVDRGMVIEGIALLEKAGGKSGPWRR